MICSIYSYWSIILAISSLCIFLIFYISFLLSDPLHSFHICTPCILLMQIYLSSFFSYFSFLLLIYYTCSPSPPHFLSISYTSSYLLLQCYPLHLSFFFSFFSFGISTFFFQFLFLHIFIFQFSFSFHLLRFCSFSFSCSFFCFIFFYILFPTLTSLKTFPDYVCTSTVLFSWCHVMDWSTKEFQFHSRNIWK